MMFRNFFSEYSLQVEPVSLSFDEGSYSDVFTRKNNKTLRETIAHGRYDKYSKTVLKTYSGQLDEPLGTFLGLLKYRGDDFYKKFLNKFGDGTYSVFRITNEAYLEETGVYAFFVGDEIVYIGRCRDSMKKRINLGYGKIHPKNCYIDGQATNCHLNSLITKVRNKVSLWMIPVLSDAKIKELEINLIRRYKPKWNIQKY